MTRRGAIGRLGALLAAGLWPGSPRAGAAPARTVGAFTFAALNDLHHAAPECDDWFAERFQEVAARQPEFVLLLGDLAHRGQPASLEAIDRLSAQAGAPTYPVPGNHDNDLAGDPSLYAQQFPGMLNYRFEHRGWQFVGIDTTEGTAWRDTRVAASTLDWLDAEVPRLDPRRPTVLFTHFPLAAGIVTQQGHVLTPLNAEEVLMRLERVNLRTVLSGHFHGRTQRESRGVPLVTGACCSRVDRNHDGTPTKGWWLCHAEADGALRREFVALPAK